MLDHSFYMNLALTEAWKYQFLTYPNPAVGAVILGEHGEILAIEAHQEAGQAHAEVKALLAAYVKLQPEASTWGLLESSDIHDYLTIHHQNLFKNATLYTTLAPCNHIGKTPSCSSLIKTLGIKRVVIGSQDPHSVGGIELLKNLGVDVTVGIEKEACDDLLAPFLVWQSKKPFVFFKMAQRLNGSYDGGVISNEASREHVHQIRSVIDDLVIGGNTVKLDRPTLDTRLLSHGKNPHVTIFSHEKAFDCNIPLFSISDREVTIEDDKKELFSYPFTMIEGGEGSFKALKESIDWILLYVSGTMATGLTMQTAFNAKIMHVMPLDDNYLLWMKKIEG